MRKLLLISFLFLGGCGTLPYTGPFRYSIGVPSAAAVSIYLRHDGNTALNGNTYSFPYIAMTNTNSSATDDPTVQAYNANLATNRWPYKRMHMELSIDGGFSWPRRIGYGLQPGGPFGEFLWSPPEDYSLLTTNARIRLRTMAETAPVVHMGDGMPFDNPIDDPVMSPPFTIAGATITNPVAGAYIYKGVSNNIIWKQAGGGTVMRLYWITPSTVNNATNQLVTTYSNCVEGLNVRPTMLTAIPPAGAVKLAIRSVSDPELIGYSGIFDLEP